jgi:hypothetical protein
MVLALKDAGEPCVVIDNMHNGVPWAIPKGVPFVPALSAIMSSFHG